MKVFAYECKSADEQYKLFRLIHKNTDIDYYYCGQQGNREGRFEPKPKSVRATFNEFPWVCIESGADCMFMVCMTHRDDEILLSWSNIIHKLTKGFDLIEWGPIKHKMV